VLEIGEVQKAAGTLWHNTCRIVRPSASARRN
jgi:hypothetical protein